MPTHFLDTNILLYSISADPSEKDKKDRAADLMDGNGGAISVQVLQEFYVNATKPTRNDRISHDKAAAFIAVWSRFVTQPTTVELLYSALDVKRRHGFAYWDSAIIAAARELGCPTLYTEDMSHGQIVDGVRIVNPFL